MLWKKKDGGLGLVNPTKATNALLSKWVLHALELKEANLYCLFMCRLKKYQISGQGKWAARLEWCMLVDHKRAP